MGELFKEINRIPISKEIMKQLKESILNGTIKAGEKIPSERELTEQFNVSRNMVREAIRGLEMLGYLEIHQGARGGAFVKDFTHDRLSNVILDFYQANQLSVEDLLQARLLIEPEAARLAASRITTAESLLLMETWKRESYKDDIRDRMESLSATHLMIAKLSGNKLYEIIINALIAINHEIVLNIFKTDRDEPPHGLGKHDEIVKAVVEQNPDRAGELMTQHLNKFLDGLLKIVKRYNH